MNNFLLAAIASSQAGSVQINSQTLNIIIQYCVYGAIIIVSIILLALLHKYTRLPKHSEFKKKLSALQTDMADIDTNAKRMDFIKSVTRAIYKADSLAYTATMLSEKERYSDFGKISSLIQGARAELSPYKYGKREQSDDEGIKTAEKIIASAVEILNGVIERDGELRRKKN